VYDVLNSNTSFVPFRSLPRPSSSRHPILFFPFPFFLSADADPGSHPLSGGGGSDDGGGGGKGKWGKIRSQRPWLREIKKNEWKARRDAKKLEAQYQKRKTILLDGHGEADRLVEGAHPPHLLGLSQATPDTDYATDDAVARCLGRIEKAQRTEQLQGKVVGLLWNAAHG
jgi:hypothetical protein